MSNQILAIDTVTESTSLALCTNHSIFTRVLNADHKHSRVLLPLVVEMLAEARISLNTLDLLAYCQGPGSFTGVRLGLTCIQGLALALSCPVVGVSSLQAMAQEAYARFESKAVFATLDARMGEVYWGYYTLDSYDLMHLAQNERVSSPHILAAEIKKTKQAVVVGSGMHLLDAHYAHHTSIQSPQAEYFLPFAKCALLQKQIYNASEAHPVYLRNKVAEVKQT